MFDYQVTIAICSGGMVCVETLSSLIGAMDTCRQKGLNVGLVTQVGNHVSFNRNDCVDVARRNNSERILFIDSDMIFPPSGVVRLYDHDKDIVGANYNMRGNPTIGNPGDCTVKMADAKGNMLAGPASMLPNQLFKAHALGTGFMMIKMSVFDKFPRPYFYLKDNGTGDPHTEDIQFCMDAHNYGFDTWVSPTIQLGHIGTTVY